MISEKLVTREDIAQYKQISKTPNDAKLNECIVDAQLIDIAPLLGEKLFNKIMAAPEDYQDLLEGGDYTYSGITYKNYGLKAVISYFVYARYKMFGSDIDTPFSSVQKLSDNSTPTPEATKKTLYNLNRESAMQIWANVKAYLIRSKNPDFNSCKSELRRGTFKFTKL